MRNKFIVGTTMASMLFVGCSRSSEQEIASLRTELVTAKAEISRLKAEIERTKDGNKQNDAKPASNAKARLVVVRGLRLNWEYPIYEGRNILGRAEQLPVDIDLQPQEPVERIWSSHQHAAIICKNGGLVIEDLNSANGTYVNRKRVPPGEKCSLRKDDVIQIGEVHMKVLQ